MPAGIQPERILRDLAELWTNLAQAEPGATAAAGVLRACAMTLIVAAEDAADAQAASETLGELMHEHPSRAIVLKPSGAGELDARVFAQCWIPFGGGQQICCEQIEIAAAPERLGDVPGLMLGLLASDLPVVLWCRGPRWFAEPHFKHLLPLIGKLIVDSAHFPNPASAFERIAELSATGLRVADLEWPRLTGWREIIAHAFDSPGKWEQALHSTSMRVAHGGARPGACTYYLAAWLQAIVPAAAIAIESRPDDPPGIREVTIEPVSFRAGEGCTVEIRAGESVHAVVLPVASDYVAMREELGISRRDTVYEQVFPIARQLAGAR